MAVRLLPEETDPDGTGRPLRPDLPWLRNLSWTKVHAMQLGFGFAILVYWGLALGAVGAAFGLAVLVAEFVLGEAQEQTDRSLCDHDLGFHDVAQKPWYFLSAAVVVYGVMAAIWGVPY